MIMNDKRAMDCGALHLKPFVTIKAENRPQSPKEDQDIRHDPTATDILTDDSHLPEEVGDFRANNRGRYISAEGASEHGDKSEDSSYSVLTVRSKSMSCGIVVFNNFVFYEKPDFDKCVEKITAQKRQYEAVAERSLKEDIHMVDNDVLNAKEQSPTEKLTQEDAYPHGVSCHKDRYSLQVPCMLLDLEAELSNILSKGFSKVSGKRQRRKKLTDLLGPFDSFHYLNPAPVEVVVFPVQRQNRNQGEDPNEQADKERSSSPQSQDSWPPDSIDGRPWADFRHELHRLGTFVNVASNFPISVLSLARAGFLCWPDGAIVCYFCGVRRDHWHVGESAVDIHRYMNPVCSILTGMNCDNVPVTTPGGDQLPALMEAWSLSRTPVVFGFGRNTGGQTPAARQREVFPQMSQMMSAQSSPDLQGGSPQSSAVGGGLQASPSSGAQVSGLGPGPASAAAAAPTVGQNANASSSHNLAVSNRQASVSTDSEQANQADGTDPTPQSSNEQQSGASSSGNERQGQITDGTAQPGGGSAASGGRTQQVVTYSQLGIMTEAPRRPEMATVNARVSSFHSWSSTSTLTPQALADAGFYYAAVCFKVKEPVISPSSLNIVVFNAGDLQDCFGDCARCFQCGGGLRNWNPAENPWVEHARRFRTCAYVRLCQGQEFIDIILELSSQGESVPVTMAQVQQEITSRRLGGDYIADRTIDPAIIAVQPLGCSQQAIDAGIQRLQADGYQLTADRLLDYLEEDGVLAGAGNITEAGGENDVEDLVTRNNEIRQQHLCKICMDREATIVFLSCGHLVCCSACSPPVVNCPVCRERIKGRLRAFPC